MNTSLILLSFLVLAPCSILAQSKSDVEKAIEQVNVLRESLVKGVNTNPDLKTFKQVCSPVGMNIKQIKKRKNILIRQATHKFRNPKNQANSLEEEVIAFFEKNPNKESLWKKVGDKNHYFQKITVRKDCLACHGAKSKRPDFVIKKYLQDNAFGFNVGDLRGIYHYVPE